MPFDPNAYGKTLDGDIEKADANIKQQYAQALNALKGLSQAQLTEFGGTTEQMNAIIKEVENATAQNLSQAALIDNLKALGQSTYDLARKVMTFIP